jgi:hypothetical protein
MAMEDCRLFCLAGLISLLLHMVETDPIFQDRGLPVLHLSLQQFNCVLLGLERTLAQLHYINDELLQSQREPYNGTVVLNRCVWEHLGP